MMIKQIALAAVETVICQRFFLHLPLSEMILYFKCKQMFSISIIHDIIQKGLFAMLASVHLYIYWIRVIHIAD